MPKERKSYKVSIISKDQGPEKEFMSAILSKIEKGCTKCWGSKYDR